MLVKMTNMNSESYNKMSSTLRITISYPRFTKLKESAKNTIGKEDDLLILELDTFFGCLYSFRFKNQRTAGQQ